MKGLNLEPWPEFTRAFQKAKVATPCPTVEISVDWLCQYADDYLGPASELFHRNGDVREFTKFMDCTQVAGLAEFLPDLVPRLRGKAQEHFLDITRMWHWLQLYLNEHFAGEPAGRPLLTEGIERFLGDENTRVPANVWQALEVHLTLKLVRPAWNKPDFLRLHECLVARGLVLDADHCYPKGGVEQAPEEGRFYWVYQWPEQALWLILEKLDPPVAVQFQILGAALLNAPWVTGPTTHESLAIFYQHFEALQRCFPEAHPVGQREGS